MFGGADGGSIEVGAVSRTCSVFDFCSANSLLNSSTFDIFLGSGFGFLDSVTILFDFSATILSIE